MIKLSDLKRFLNLESIDEKIERYGTLEERAKASGENIDVLAKSFMVEKGLFETRMKQPENSVIADRITEKWNNFLKEHKAEISKAKKEYKAVENELKILTADPVISKAIEEIKKQNTFQEIKKSYKSGEISPAVYNSIIKGITKEAVVKYADFILFNEDGNMLLLKRSSWEDDNGGAWVIPGGHVDPNEDFATAALRELKEESGYTPISYTHVGSHEDGKVHIEYYSGHVNTKEQNILLDVMESRDYRWIPSYEINEYEMVFNMRENIMRILGIPEPEEAIIRKGDLDFEEQKESRIEALNKEFGYELVKSIIRKKDFIEKGMISEAMEVQGEIQKAMRDYSKLKKLKKLVYRDGKLVRGTFWVRSDMFDVEVDKEGRAIEGRAGIIKTDVTEGDYLTLATKRKAVTGHVHGFSKHDDGKVYISLLEDDGSVTWVNVDSVTKMSKADKTEGDFDYSKLFETSSSVDFPVPSTLTEVKELGGSSGVKLMKAPDGSLWAKKVPHKGELVQLEREKACSDLYMKMGFKAPVTKIYPAAKVMISKYMENVKQLSAVTITDEIRNKAKQGFVLDCVIGNWDVIGACKDNMLIDEKGDIVRIDNGGSFTQRARGGEKAFADTVTELKTMREYGHGKDIYSTVTDADIRKQTQQIIKHRADIIATARFFGEDTAKTCEKRIAWLATQYGGEAAVEVKKEAPKPVGEVLRAGMPSLATQKYFDSKWSKVDISGNAGIKEHIKNHIIKMENLHASKYNEIARSKGMTVEQLKERMLMMVQDIVDRSKGYIVAHSSASSSKAIVGAVLSEGRFKTQFETGTSKGSYSPDYRSRTESGFFGFDGKKEDKSMRPIYGFFTDHAHGAINSSGTVPPPRSVSQYGDVCFEVKDKKFRKDATVTFSDSLGDESSKSASPVSAVHFTSFSPHYYDQIEKMYKGKVSHGEYGSSYVESQYHGQLKLTDLEKIHVSHKSYSSMKELTQVVNEINAATLKGGTLVPIEIF